MQHSRRLDTGFFTSFNQGSGINTPAISSLTGDTLVYRTGATPAKETPAKTKPAKAARIPVKELPVQAAAILQAVSDTAFVKAPVLPGSFGYGHLVMAPTQSDKGWIHKKFMPALVMGVVRREGDSRPSGLALLRFLNPAWAPDQAHDFRLDRTAASDVPHINVPTILGTGVLEYMPLQQEVQGKKFDNRFRPLDCAAPGFVERVYARLMDNEKNGVLQLKSWPADLTELRIVPTLASLPETAYDLPGIKPRYWPAMSGLFDEFRATGMDRIGEKIRTGLEQALRQCEALLEEEKLDEAQGVLSDFVSQHEPSTACWTALGRLHEQFARAGHVACRDQAKAMAREEYEFALARQPQNTLARDGLGRLQAT